MGCRVSNESSPITMPKTNDEVEFKSRLERKICVAKETPEPEYDLSHCNLKDVPSGVFIMCKVLRKEALILSNNKLHNLSAGGALNDLCLLVSLNLSVNKFKKLPIEISQLENLKELLLSENLIEILPPSINQLKKLELLDLSNNRLTNINPISMMPSLRILNISNNPKLVTLPTHLATCESLFDIILDSDIIQYPPENVIEQGTLGILQFLETGVIDVRKNELEKLKKVTQNFISEEKNEKHSKYELNMDKHTKEKLLLEQERSALEKDYFLEAQFHNEQQQKKRELMEQLLAQQNETESKVMDLRKAKELERDKLICEIIQADEYSNMVVDNLLHLKNGPDPILLEKERLEQETLLEQLRIHQCNLRKQEILSAMTDLLRDEVNIIQSYQEQRDNSSKNLLEQENQTNRLLENVFINYDRNRSGIVDKINQDEELQKKAVAALITKNDSRSWALVEQVRIVEAQLATMTYYEIERKKLSTDETMDELAESRLNLTYILLDLLDQQEKRKEQLFNTLRAIEIQNEENRQDYWLLQYQKLLDSQPADFSLQQTSIDPRLGYNFLINGVVQCLPFLSKLFKEKDLIDITNDDLMSAGVNKTIDRTGILSAIESFLIEIDNKNIVDDEQKPHPIYQDNASVLSHSDSINTRPITECVICMEHECKIIFLPCGHLCCCFDCQTNLDICPICRTVIDRRIKMIRP